MNEEISEDARKYIEDIQRIFARQAKTLDEIERLFDEMRVDLGEMKNLFSEVRHRSKETLV